MQWKGLAICNMLSTDATISQLARDKETLIVVCPVLLWDPALKILTPSTIYMQV